MIDKFRYMNVFLRIFSVFANNDVTWLKLIYAMVGNEKWGSTSLNACSNMGVRISSNENHRIFSNENHLRASVRWRASTHVEGKGLNFNHDNISLKDTFERIPLLLDTFLVLKITINQLLYKINNLLLIPPDTRLYQAFGTAYKLKSHWR